MRKKNGNYCKGLEGEDLTGEEKELRHVVPGLSKTVVILQGFGF
jgi:hypothetical protein